MRPTSCRYARGSRLKYNYVRVTPASLTGRAFEIGPEPDRYGTSDY